MRRRECCFPAILNPERRILWRFGSDGIVDRRSFLSLACVSGGGYLLPQEPEQKTSPFERADRLLKVGRNFEEAASLLRQVVAEEPQNYRAFLALACACANRAATLSRAYEFTEILDRLKKTYPVFRKEWNAAQQRPNENTYASLGNSAVVLQTMPRPDPPPAYLRTRDDGKPFRLTTAELKEALDALLAESESALHRAEESAKTPQEKADVLWHRAWITRLLDMANGYAWPPQVGKNGAIVQERLFPNPDIKKARADLEEALRLTPEFARCWETLADLLENGVKFSDVTDLPKAEVAYKQAVKYKPENAPLWFHLFFLEQAKGFPPPEPDDDDAPSTPPRQYTNPDILRFYLKQAARYEPENGAYALQEACLLNRDLDYTSYVQYEPRLYTPFAPVPNESDEDRADRETREQQRLEDLKDYREILADAGNRAGIESVLALVEKAVSAARLEAPLYRGRPPEWLRFPWEYYVFPEHRFPWMSEYRAVGRALGGYALFAAREEKSVGIAERVCPVIINLGLRLISGWPVVEQWNKDGHPLIIVLIGISVVEIGYSAWERSLAIAGGSDERRAAVAKEHATYSEKAAHYKATISRFDVELLGY